MKLRIPLHTRVETGVNGVDGHSFLSKKMKFKVATVLWDRKGSFSSNLYQLGLPLIWPCIVRRLKNFTKDHALSDYHLFTDLKKNMNDKVKTVVRYYFKKKKVDGWLYDAGIQKLPDRLQNYLDIIM